MTRGVAAGLGFDAHQCFLCFQCPADVLGFGSEPADVQKKKRDNNFQEQELNRPFSFCRQVHIPLGYCTNLLCTGLMNETSGRWLGFVMHLPRNIFLLDVLHL